MRRGKARSKNILPPGPTPPGIPPRAIPRPPDALIPRPLGPIPTADPFPARPVLLPMAARIRLRPGPPLQVLILPPGPIRRLGSPGPTPPGIPARAIPLPTDALIPLPPRPIPMEAPIPVLTAHPPMAAPIRLRPGLIPPLPTAPAPPGPRVHPASRALPTAPAPVLPPLRRLPNREASGKSRPAVPQFFLYFFRR